jgi:DNA-3-methyladenine glycosylase
MPRLDRDFFARDTLLAARQLLGCTLVHEVGGERVSGRVVEVEAYRGIDDQASHAHRGKTPRNAAMFGPAGICYIYFIYGMYWLLNVVARPSEAGYPAAVLLRALEPLEGLHIMAANRPARPPQEWTSGPGRLTQALGLDGALNGSDMTAPDSPLYFETGLSIPDDWVRSGPRVGINVPEPWRSKPWRFWINGNAHVSATR